MAIPREENVWPHWVVTHGDLENRESSLAGCPAARLRVDRWPVADLPTPTDPNWTSTPQGESVARPFAAGAPPWGEILHSLHRYAPSHAQG